MKFRNIESGRRWAYVGLWAGLVVSIAGNVTNTVLANSIIPLWLRVPLAIVWPTFTYVAIEVLTRNAWRKTVSHFAARAVLWVPVGIVAGVVSYTHLHHLMIVAGERAVASTYGPLAIDGMLVGCTVALLLTRPLPALPPSVEEIWERYGLGSTEEMEEQLASLPPAPVSSPPRTRAARWNVEGTVHALLSGATVREVAGQQLASSTTAGRVQQAINLLREDPSAEVPPGWKVPPVVVQEILRQVAGRRENW